MTIDGTTQPTPTGPDPDAGTSPDLPVHEWAEQPPAGYYVAYPTPQVRSPQARRRRRTLFAVGTVWLLVLLVSGVWYSFHGAHTVREQTTVAEAVPVVDTATAWVLRAAGPQPAAVLGGFVSGGSCDITPVRRGEQWSRTVRLATPVGGEAQLVTRIADGLPGRYHARVHSGSAATTFYADAGEFVSVSGSTEAPGLVRVVASTGCRAIRKQPAADPVTAPAGTDRAAVDAILAELGVGATGWQVHELSCAAAGTGSVRTVTATAPAPRSGGLDKQVTPDGTVLVSAADLVVARDGALATVTRAGTDTLTVSATTGGCTG